MDRSFPLILLSFGLLIAGTSCAPINPAAQSQSAIDVTETEASEPGEGVLCHWAIAGRMAEVGRLCPVTQNADFQAALEESVRRTEEYVVANGETNADDIAKFRAQQVTISIAPNEECPVELVSMYDFWQEQGVEAVRDLTDSLLARPGIPQWGDCL